MGQLPRKVREQQRSRMGGEHRLQGGESLLSRCDGVIVLMKTGETSDEAWERHLESHPENEHAEIRIFLDLQPGPKFPSYS